MHPKKLFHFIAVVGFALMSVLPFTSRVYADEPTYTAYQVLSSQNLNGTYKTGDIFTVSITAKNIDRLNWKTTCEMSILKSHAYFPNYQNEYVEDYITYLGGTISHNGTTYIWNKLPKHKYMTSLELFNDPYVPSDGFPLVKSQETITCSATFRVRRDFPINQYILWFTIKTLPNTGKSYAIYNGSINVTPKTAISPTLTPPVDACYCPRGASCIGLCPANSTY